MSKLDKLIEKAKEHLDNDEQVVVGVLGTYETKIMNQDSVRSGALIATNKRLVFFAKKLMGYDLEVFPYSNISSIEASKGLMGHKINIFSSGNKVKMKWIKDGENMKKLIGYTKDNIGKSHAGQSNSSTDTAEQIKKLSELKEQGILTQEEFESKKRELLAKM